MDNKIKEINIYCNICFKFHVFNSKVNIEENGGCCISCYIF